jgi:RimJ/RimL family protein N-acetyltransferase
LQSACTRLPHLSCGRSAAIASLLREIAGLPGAPIRVEKVGSPRIGSTASVCHAGSDGGGPTATSVVVLLAALSASPPAQDNQLMQLRPSYPISTPRLRLRPLAVADIEELLVYRGSPEVCRYLPFAPMDEQVLTARLAGDLGRTEITGEGQGLTLGVELASSGRLVGDVVLFFQSADHAGGEIGYVFHPDVAGQGYAAEACAAVLDLAFDSSDGLGLHRVVARMDARNGASVRLASRLGMRREAHFRSSEMFKGAWADLVIYGLLGYEWHARRSDRSTGAAASSRAEDARRSDDASVTSS